MSLVYFIQAGSRGPYKIGVSRDPQDRCDRIAREFKRKGEDIGHLYVCALMPGDMGVEKYLHERFAEGRLHGEWFAYETPGLHELISAALHFEGFWPEDKESPIIHDVLDVLKAAEYPVPERGYWDGWY